MKAAELISRRGHWAARFGDGALSADARADLLETIRDGVPGFTGVISDPDGPTANMYRLACKSPEIESPEYVKELAQHHVRRRRARSSTRIPYFIAAHTGRTDEDRLELAVWLKQNGFRADQVQSFLPSLPGTLPAVPIKVPLLQ